MPQLNYGCGGTPLDRHESAFSRWHPRGNNSRAHHVLTKGRFVPIINHLPCMDSSTTSERWVVGEHLRDKRKVIFNAIDKTARMYDLKGILVRDVFR